MTKLSKAEHYRARRAGITQLDAADRAEQAEREGVLAELAQAAYDEAAARPRPPAHRPPPRERA